MALSPPTTEHNQKQVCNQEQIGEIGEKNLVSEIRFQKMFLGIVEDKTTPVHTQIVCLLFPLTAQLQKRKYGYGKIKKQHKNVEVNS